MLNKWAGFDPLRKPSAHRSSRDRTFLQANSRPIPQALGIAYLVYWRKNVTGIVQGPLPSFWGVSKTV